MNLSMKWLQEFVDIDMSDKEFSEAMTMSGSKVESFEHEGALINKVVVGKVLEIEKHPDADKLVVCKIDVAQEQPLQIVTGATNLNIGDIIPVALDGSTLFDGKKIKKGKLRGVLSQGMLCSLSELGLTVNDFPYAIEDGIFVLEEKCSIGQDIKCALGLDDTKFEFEITSNRADCFSVIGLAREVAATFEKNLKLHTPELKSAKDSTENAIDVKILDKDLCQFYSAQVVTNVKIGPSPKWIRERLRSMGVRPINNIVDITNYVMLEYGQPMHAFDLDKINDNQLFIRKANDGEKLTIIDGTQLTLNSNNLVIADNQKSLALAGVMGGKTSGIDSQTKTIIFESATFEPICIRRTARKFGLRTESSSRYEKGLDPNNCVPALKRACELVQLLQVGDLVNDVQIDSDYVFSPTKIKFDVEFINSFISINLTKEEMKIILQKIDCNIINDEVVVPSYRSDLTCKADIAEEIARFYGYNKIKSKPLKSATIGRYNSRQYFEKTVNDTMLAFGLNQIMTYSFTDPKNCDKINMSKTSDLRDQIKIKNPLGEATSVMRTTAIPSMLEVLSHNYNNQNLNVKVFEIAKEYLKTSNEKLPNEKLNLIIGMYGQNVDFFDLKGILEDLMDKVSISDYDVRSSNQLPEYHTGRCAQVFVQDVLIGSMGQIHPAVCENYQMQLPVFLMSLDIDLLFEKRSPIFEYKSLPKYPSVERDLCLICQKDVPVSSLVKYIWDCSGNLLENVEIFDVYSGKQIEKNKKSVALKLTLRSQDSTLTDKQICSVTNKIVRNLKNSGVTLRE